MYNAMNFKHFDKINKLMRSYFSDKRGFIEVPAQSNLSILAACEDPNTIGQYIFGGRNYPLPQTGQIVLEEVLLENPDVKGVFCQTTSFRDEPNPVPGRHDLIFQMLEFEGKGGFKELKRTEAELLEHLGFGKLTPVDYRERAKKYGVDVLEAGHEERMRLETGNVISLEKFPQESHPFWNMKYNGDGTFNKVDVILHGMETIGSAERSCDPEEMYKFFNTVSDGDYKRLLFNKFTKKRVMEELDKYLAHIMIPRYGAGIGMTRMERAMALEGLLGAEAREKFLQKVA